jgi:class 3 adenylate cyclase
MAVCASCGTENPEGFRFCGACAAPLAPAPAPRQTRKVVTALFCDVTGSTALGEELDPEVLRGVMNRYFSEIRATIERHGGTVEKFIGDAVMAVFGIPSVQEDDALRAVRAAAEIRERLPALAQEVGVALRFRTGVNTGPVLSGQGENMAIGDAINVAARLEQAAAPGEIVLGADTLQLVRDAVEVQALEPLTLKGKSEPLAAYRLLRVDPVAPGVARHLDAVVVGRARELALLRGAWDRTVQESDCHLFTLLGTAGVGKSRVVAELLKGIGDGATVLRGRCLHYGDGITFWPLVEALMEAGDVAGPVLEHLGSDGVALPEELFWEVRRLLESLARERPVILHIDDLQWAETMLMDLLDHVADLSRGAPILLLCTARPELLDVRPGWGGGKLNAAAVLLQPLGAADSEALLDQLGAGLDPAARARVIAASDGNPLFLEEMVALARDRGAVTVPPTIQALLAARLEGLEVDEREVLERGAVEGEVFHSLAVRALSTERPGAEVQLRLGGLVRKELIRPHPATLAGEDAFRFRHLLIRDAAYEGLPKVIRAELHQRFAGWLEQLAVELVDGDEIAGWHLEQALRYQHELGQALDPALARHACELLAAAGWRAARRGDAGAARNLLERALALAPEGHESHSRIAVDLAEQLIEFGEIDRARELLSIAEHDPSVSARAALNRLELRHRTEAGGATEAVAAALPGLLEQLAQAGDERGLAQAHMVAFWAAWGVSLATPAAREVRLAAEHARNAGDEGLRSRALAWYIATLMWGPSPAGTLAAELDEIERQETGAYLRPFVDLGRAEQWRLERDFAAARARAERSIESLAALGLTMEAAAWLQLGEGEVSAGDLEAALAAKSRADTILAAAGERAFRSTAQANLAEIHQLRGDRDAAHAALALSDELTAADDEINYSITHRVRARLALAEGDAQAAEAWARSGVEHAFRTDFLLDRARTKLELGRVLAALDRPGEAAPEAHAALELFHTKGDRTGAAEAQTLLDRLPTS